ncbi:PREDICTED: ATP-dependent RNA helicase glh-2-like [Priapulus caudatus]|uniref:ATP-dependent RNA helicase glh-2-like n=1 Tax=Priapulus caudatus TaxID=37621 RepID=A0ABM1F5E8_PRICU|nr:PREDICTED: ATP-dependent RNA helicase glh-2-like [Priapulus caudatus]
MKLLVSFLMACCVAACCSAWESAELIKRGYVIVPSSAGAVIPLRGHNGETMYYAIKISYFQGGRAGVGQAVASAAQAGRTAAAAVHAGSAGFRVSNAASAGFQGGASGTTGALFRTISVDQVPTTRLQQGGRAGVGQAVASAAQADRTAAAAVHAGSAGFRVSNAARAGFQGGASGTTGALFRTMSVGQVPTTRLQQVS